MMEDIQALGRWGSATMLEYVEEAFTELPRGLPPRLAEADGLPGPSERIAAIANQVANPQFACSPYAN